MNFDNPGSTLLLVDDNAANLSWLVEKFLSQGFQLMVAESGESALERLRYRTPNLILLDVRMTGIDGYETCRRIKARPETADVPVIFLSVISDADEKIQGFQAGGVDFISKPLDFTEVLQRVRTHLTLYHLRQELAKTNSELEQRVAVRTAALEEEIARRTQSEAEKSLLLEVLRSQGRQLQATGSESLNGQTAGRKTLAQTVGRQVSDDLYEMKKVVDALLSEVVDGETRRRLERLGRLLGRVKEAVEGVAISGQRPAAVENVLRRNPLLRLSDREQEVLLLIVRRQATDEIAQTLHLSPSTVRTYRYRILQKLELKSMEELEEYALRHRLMDE